MELKKLKVGDILALRDGHLYMGTFKEKINDDEVLCVDVVTVDKEDEKNIGYHESAIFHIDNTEKAKEDQIAFYKSVLTERKCKYDNMKANCIKPLDFVMLNRGLGSRDIGLVTETNGVGGDCSVDWIVEGTDLKNAWWEQKELKKINNLANLIAKEMTVPVYAGGNPDVVDKFY